MDPEDRKRRINQIIQAVTSDIPGRPRPPPKPRKFWLGLKVGDTLLRHSDNYIFTVTEVDSHGVTMEPPLRLEDKGWRTKWSKMRKTKTPKK